MYEAFSCCYSVVCLLLTETLGITTNAIYHMSKEVFTLSPINFTVPLPLVEFLLSVIYLHFGVLFCSGLIIGIYLSNI